MAYGVTGDRALSEDDGLPNAIVNGQRVHGALPAATCLDAVAQALHRTLAHPGR